MDCAGDSNVLSIIASNLTSQGQTEWNTTDGDVCNWSGVVCNSTCVISLDLGNLNLNVNIEVFALVGNLLMLSYLSLSGNHLFGSLPSSWGKLINLNHIELWGNKIGGLIPLEYMNWNSTISYIDFDDNLLSGSLPCKEWSTFTMMTYLDLGANQFKGSLCSEWADWTLIQQLYLFSNLLSSSLPCKAWSNFNTSLNTISVYGNTNIYGSLCQEWTNFSQLQYLFFEQSNLVGAIPCESWSSMRSLIEISLFENQLTGTLCQEWNSTLMPNLTYIYLSSNAFSGSLPCDEWSDFPLLYDLELDNNKLKGNICENWSLLPSLSSMLLNNNELEGYLPESYGNLSYLINLDLSHNMFLGNLPLSWYNLTVQRLGLGGNNFQGPMFDFSGFQNLTHLDLFNCGFEGEFSWSKLPLIDSLQFIDLSGNFLYGQVNLQEGFNPAVLNISYNKFSTLISEDAFSSIKDVFVVDITGNNIPCPYPTMFNKRNPSASIVFLFSGCTEPWKLVEGIYIGMFVLILLFITMTSRVMVTMLYSEDNKLLNKTLATVLIIKLIAVDVFSLIDLVVIDLPVYQAILAELYKIKTSSNCLAVNHPYLFTAFLPLQLAYQLPNGTIWDPFPPLSWYDSFSQWPYLMLYGSYSKKDVENGINAFKELCNSFGEECIYDPVSYTCVENPNYLNRFDGFHIFVLVSMYLWIFKETLKVCAVVYCFFSRKAHIHLRTFLSGSFAAPILFLRLPNFYEEIISHRSSLMELYMYLFYESIVEHIPQFIVSLYFVFVVAGSGLSWQQFFILPSNLSSLVVTLLLIYYARKNEKMVKVMEVQAEGHHSDNKNDDGKEKDKSSLDDRTIRRRRSSLLEVIISNNGSG